MTGSKQDIRIPVENIPEGESRNFSYTVTVREEGCPVVKKILSKTVTNPKQKKESKKDKKGKNTIKII
jgi:hypothetical protein